MIMLLLTEVDVVEHSGPVGEFTGNIFLPSMSFKPSPACSYKACRLKELCASFLCMLLLSSRAWMPRGITCGGQR
jgi:hypothetical protein